MSSPTRSPTRKAVRLSQNLGHAEFDDNQPASSCADRIPGPGNSGGDSHPDEDRVSRHGQRRRREPRLTELQEAFLQLNVASTLNCGNEGQSLELVTNFFDIETIPKFMVHEYSVEFDPECVRKRSRLDILNKLSKLKFLDSFAYDGAKMYVVRKLKNEEVGEDNSVVNTECQFRGNQYSIIFKHVNVVAPNTLPYVQLLSVIFRNRLLRLGMRTINRNLYDMGNQHRIQEQGIYIFPGAKSSILPCGRDGKLLLCVDKLHKILNSSTLDEYMYSFERWDQRDKEEARRFLVGQSVVTRYNMNSYRIEDVDFEKTIDSTFEQADGKEISYREYYKEHYNENLRCRDLPLLAVRSRNRKDGSRSSVYLVPELCHLSGVNTGTGGNLNVMRSLAKHCGPAQRMSYIVDMLRRIYDQTTEEQRETGIHWGLNIKSKSKVISGRCLQPIQPIMDGGKSNRSWNQVCSSMMLRPIPLDNWVVLHGRGTDAHSLINGIWDMMTRLGIEPRQPTVNVLDGDNARATHDMIQRLRSSNEISSRSTQLILYIQQDRSLDRIYKEAKKILGQQFGFVSQFVKGRNCRTKPAIYQKIALQIGCKIGGEPWAMQIPFKKPTMIIGIDCHRAKGAQTIAACVATMNRLCSKFYSRCVVQQEGQDMLGAVGGFVAEAVTEFKERNKGRYPDQVIVYRDGVGDGQLGFVRDNEVSQLSQIIRINNPNCLLTFIVVKKRGSARFFCRQGHYDDQISNPPAGTIVDDIVTHTGWRDFYLIPQKVTQGTATPSHFNILIDECDLSNDFIQDMTFKLCHMYYNWTGPIRVPSVCQYANKLAFLVGTCMSSEPSEASMYSKLYYL